ncbi:hypothetical protein AB2S31_10920 [Elizabethkingia anophelis]|uniref:hypothetical protein n=1 Tax=Elizabethkingia anophelis TaxID=1117645 RepID=UPI003462CDE7
MSKIKRITPTDFGGQYMPEISSDFAILKTTPIQVHDIAKTLGFIKVPTPLHRPEFNSLFQAGFQKICTSAKELNNNICKKQHLFKRKLLWKLLF